MPRPKRVGAPPPKTRSRNGCKPCKARKIKCDEGKPSCLACKKHGDPCDYTVDLKWNGRQKREPDRVSKTTPNKQVNFAVGMFTARPTTSTATRTENGSGASDTPHPDKHGQLHEFPITPFKASFSRSEPFDTEHLSNRSLIDPALSSILPPILYPIGNESQQIRGTAFEKEQSGPSTPSERQSAYSVERELRYDGLRSFGRERLDSAAGHATQDTRDFHRLSVSSLLSGPPGISPLNNQFYHPRADVKDWSVQHLDTTTWGVDRGFVDLDVPNNDDNNAISGASPVALKSHLDMINDHGSPPEFGFGMEISNTAFDSGNYYDKPVPINLPRVLEPLPKKLLENPMNLLYFHHFLNHTADCLLPHNCSSNPFKNILPQMAVRDDNLLNLLLAYSASHRARFLRQPEPATRIAIYMRDTFPNLRHALDDPNEVISNSTLATAIMLASLEIISPTAFGIEVPWQQHLGIAREIIAVRGGPQSMRSVALNNKVVDFLWSWFAYLDVLGSLSGGKRNASWFFDYECREETEYAIDCILGFTSRCVRLLAKIAELSRTTDSDRIGPDLEVRPEWEPSEETRASAKKLEADLIESRLHPIQPCTHMQSTGEAAYQWDDIEMTATNEAFHWAGLVHLHRRILGKPSTHHDVQQAVREILGALCKIRRGSSADVCLLFPMFTAGCETQDQKERADILERMTRVEMFGMTQVHKARTLMERVWNTGKPWETLVAGEFFG